MNLSLVCLVCFVTACAAPFEKTCTPEDGAAIERDYLAEVAAVCWGKDVCPEREAVDQKYRAKREAWVRCDP